MCCDCGRLWNAVHALWSITYITCGAVQLIAGIFFIISLPELHLSCNIWAGSWNIIIGITAGMVACFGQVSSRRQEFLLYMAVSILAVNAINAVLNEWCLYWTDIPKVLANRPYQTLIHYALFATRISAAVLILISFLDTQLAFCSMQTTRKLPSAGKKLRRSHEQVSDIEYIIPRSKSSASTKPYSAYNANTQSWVFNGNDNTSPYLKLSQNGTPKSFPEEKEKPQKKEDTKHLIRNPIVQVEEASDDSTSNSDRKLNYMKSFSRSASPAVLSASSSQISLNINGMSNALISECLEKLTEPSVYRSRLNSALSNREDDESHYQSPQQAVFRRVEAITTPQDEKVQYASLMKELQKAISKKEPDATLPHSASDNSASEKTNSKSSSRQESSRTDGKNSDAEFSRELEAALQLIQDLESPNTTIDTPSEHKTFDGSLAKGSKEPRLAVWRNSDASDNSQKTLSGSLAELTSPVTECHHHAELCTFKPVQNNGKQGLQTARVIAVHHCDSQSTSGYSSPTHKNSYSTPNWSTSSSVTGSHNDLGRPLSCTIHNTKSTAVISLYSQDTPQSKGKSITLVSISGNNEPVVVHSSKYPTEENNNYKGPTADQNRPNEVRRSSSSAAWNVKSILRKKKAMPRLCPELEAAIVKSESLAYLTELELLARHQRNKDIERQIEQRVLQQLSSPKAESNC